jgi:hypothetical protein
MEGGDVEVEVVEGMKSVSVSVIFFQKEVIRTVLFLF